MAQQLFGWNSIEALAGEIQFDIFNVLLYGDFVFAAKKDNNKIIISKRKDLTNAFIIGTSCGDSWKGIQTKAPIEQLVPQILEDFKTFKFDKSVIESFNNIITKFKN